MKITPEQYKAVQSYINYMKDLVVNSSVKNARFQLVGNPTNTLQRASLKKTKSPLALPPPSNMSSLSQAEQMKKAMDYDAYIMSLVRNTPTTKELAKTIPQSTTATSAVVQNASKNNPIYNSIWSLIKDNPKTAYTSLASIFAAPVLYSMFGGSEEASSGTVPDGTNADSTNYKLLANKAKQDINKEYANARNKTTNANAGTDTQSVTQNADNNLEQQANQKLPQNPQSGNVWGTYSGNAGIFDTSTDYTPIVPNNPILPYTPIPTNNGINNLAENIVNSATGQGITQGSTTPEKKEKPVTDTNTGMDTSKNPLGDSVKKEVNQNVKKDTANKTPTINEYTPYTPIEIPGFNAAEHIKNNPEFAMPKQEFSNNTGSTSQPTKTALNESQSDYYRYLTGYKRMSPKLAIASMGLDPNKYYYQHDPAYYH